MRRGLTKHSLTFNLSHFNLRLLNISLRESARYKHLTLLPPAAPCSNIEHHAFTISISSSQKINKRQFIWFSRFEFSRNNTVKNKDPLMNYTASQPSQSLFQRSQRNCRRDRFAVFVKILLKVLRESGDFALLNRVKQTILVCTRHNQAGDPNFTPLADTTCRLLQSVVGQVHWQRAERLIKIAVAQERADRRKSNEFDEAVQSYMANHLSLLELQQNTPPVVDASACALFPGQSAPLSSILGAAAPSFC